MAFISNLLLNEIYKELLIYRILIVLLFVLICIFLYYYFNTYYGMYGKESGVVRHGSRSKKLIALTFDDGPSPKYTPEILNILKKHHIKATFFLIGKNVEKYPDIVARINHEGHDIGNHTYSHAQMSFKTLNRFLYEINRTQNAIERVIGKRPLYFRPARGVYSPNARSIIIDKGYLMILWQISSVDWQLKNPKTIVNRVIRFTRPGDIILMHDSGALIGGAGANRYPTIKALPGIIGEMEKTGFRFVKISELIEEME